MEPNRTEIVVDGRTHVVLWKPLSFAAAMAASEAATNYNPSTKQLSLDTGRLVVERLNRSIVSLDEGKPDWNTISEVLGYQIALKCGGVPPQESDVSPKNSAAPREPGQ
jgi:hypothetical protein